jgi:hypothetical protein
MAKTNNNYAKIVAHAWKDARFKEKLLKNPKAALKEMGMDVPENIEVRVVEEKANSVTFLLPKAPAEARELSERDLQKMAGGDSGMRCVPELKMDRGGSFEIRAGGPVCGK